MARFFISYNRIDKEKVDTLIEDIASLGHACWYDKELKGGQSWWEHILENIQECDAFLFVLSQQSLDSQACQLEIEYASELGKPILPIRVSREIYENLIPTVLSKIQFIDFCQSDREAFRELAKALKELPECAVLPYPLPVPPEAPISWIGDASLLLAKPEGELSNEQQIKLLEDLKNGLNNVDDAAECSILLKKLRKRGDLLATVETEIEQAIGTTGKDSTKLSFDIVKGYIFNLLDRVRWSSISTIIPFDIPESNIQNIIVNPKSKLGVTIEIRSMDEIEYWVTRYEPDLWVRPKVTSITLVNSPRGTLSPTEVISNTSLTEGGVKIDLDKSVIKGIVSLYLVCLLKPEFDESCKNFQEYIEPSNNIDTSDPFRELIELADRLTSYEVVGFCPESGDRFLNTGTFENSYVLSLLDFALSCRRLVITGAPGSGKTTFIKHLTYLLATNWLGNSSDIPNYNQERNKPSLPIYIDLPSLVASSYFPSDLDVVPDYQIFIDYLTSELKILDSKYDKRFLNDFIEKTKIRVLLDGLDEILIPHNLPGDLYKRQLQIKSFIASISNRLPDSSIVITSRPYAYSDWSIPEFTVVEIGEFNSQQRKALFSKLLANSLKPCNSAKIDFQLFEEETAKLPIELRSTPLFVTLYISLFISRKGSLPNTKSIVIRESLSLLLNSWTRSKNTTSNIASLLKIKEPETIYTRLTELAYATIENKVNVSESATIPTALLDSHLMCLGRANDNVNPIEVLNYLRKNSGVLVSLKSDSGDEFAFAHRVFQEYLAAEFLYKKYRRNELFGKIVSLLAHNDLLWRESARYLIDLLGAECGHTEIIEYVSYLINNEIDIVKNAIAYWIAIEYVLKQWLKSDNQTLWLPETLSKKLSMSVKCLLETDTLTPIERNDFGNILGILGDIRPGVSTIDNNIPDIDWIEVPKGEYKHIDGQSEFVNQFYISKYLVTVKQFMAFVEEGGYSDLNYRLNIGVPLDYAYRNQFTKPEDILGINNHPMTGVTYFEAIAFCNWLSEKLGFPVRLPHLVEWNKAAYGMECLRFPWGEQYISGYANIDEVAYKAGNFSIGNTTSVGLYHNGVSPFGLYDMFGNVYELTEINPDLDEDERLEQYLFGGTILGSSWNEYQRTPPMSVKWPGTNRDDHVGFRLVTAEKTLLVK